MNSQSCITETVRRGAVAPQRFWRGHTVWLDAGEQSGNSTPKADQIRLMLSWYRSRDLQKVSAAAEWFVDIDIKQTIDRLVEHLDHGDPFVVDEAKETLSAFAELSLKRVIQLLDDPLQARNAVEILAAMESPVVPHLVRISKLSESFEVRMGLLKALTYHTSHPGAAEMVRCHLRDSDPLVAAFVCQELLESGQAGHRFLARVFPEEQVQVA